MEYPQDDYSTMVAQQEQQAQLEQLKKRVLGVALSSEALERLSRVRTVNPQLAQTVEMYLIQLYQQGKLKSSVTDAQLKDMLLALTEKKQTKITFRRV